MRARRLQGAVAMSVAQALMFFDAVVTRQFVVGSLAWSQKVFNMNRHRRAALVRGRARDMQRGGAGEAGCLDDRSQLAV
jgi:hypothetical protein